MKRILGFIFVFILLMSIGCSQPAPPILIPGVIVGYNVADINVVIRNGNTGYTVTDVTNAFGEFQYNANGQYWNCGNSIQITILGITETGTMICNSQGDLLGYEDSSGLHYAKFDFSGSCPTCSCSRCDSCCPSCICDCSGGSVIITDCSEEKCNEKFPCIIEECPVCEECETCADCPNCDDYCPEYPECEICEICPECDSGVLMQILGIIFGIVAGAGISLCVYKDKDGKLKFTVRMHRHEGRNYLHPTYRVHRHPYKHEYNEIMPKYEMIDGYWRYVPINER